MPVIPAFERTSRKSTLSSATVGSEAGLGTVRRREEEEEKEKRRRRKKTQQKKTPPG